MKTTRQPQDGTRGDPRLLKAVATIQGLYFLVTGVWPILSPGTFQKVTGPKEEVWLVKTMGLVFAIIGATLLFGGLREKPSLETQVLGATAAVGIAGVDIIYTAKGRIRPVYLLDAAAEGVLLLGWIAAWLRR